MRSAARPAPAFAVSQAWGSGWPRREPAPGGPNRVLSLPPPTRTTGPLPRLCPETTALGPAPERASARCFVLRAWNPRAARLSARRGAPLRRPECFRKRRRGASRDSVAGNPLPLGGHEIPSPTFRALPKRNPDPPAPLDAGPGSGAWTGADRKEAWNLSGVRQRQARCAMSASLAAVEASGDRVLNGNKPELRSLRRAGSRTAAAVAPRLLRAGVGSGAQVGVRFPACRATENNFQLFKDSSKKKSLFVSGWWFCFLHFEVGDTKQNFLPKNLAARSL